MTSITPGTDAAGLLEPVLDDLVADVLAWGRADLRDLPWRRTRDPWPVLVAEVMLQQTPVARVLPRWTEFVGLWPDVGSFAAAPLGEVLRRWQGLGYPRRARNLHLAAGAVVRDHGGSIPDDLGALLTLPGIGPYTARAVVAFAFEGDVAVVDTNIARVLARVTGRRLTAAVAQAVADAAVPLGEGWAWNQIMMDLGALVCRPTPRCEVCPIAGACAWNLAGRPDPDPAVGSAGVSTRQAPFAGSDRQARGAVLRDLADGERPVGDYRPEIVASLVADGLVVVTGDRVGLP